MLRMLAAITTIYQSTFPGPGGPLSVALLIIPGTKLEAYIDQGHELGHNREFLFPMHNIHEWFFSQSINYLNSYYLCLSFLLEMKTADLRLSALHLVVMRGAYRKYSMKQETKGRTACHFT